MILFLIIGVRKVNRIRNILKSEENERNKITECTITSMCEERFQKFNEGKNNFFLKPKENIDFYVKTFLIDNESRS